MLTNNAVVKCLEELSDQTFGGAPPGTTPQRTLLVDWRDERLGFTVGPGWLDGGSSEVRGGAKSIADLLEQYASALYSLSYGLSKDAYLEGDERESALISLRDRGAALFRRLIPLDLQAEIRGWADRTILQISTNEQWVPWELMHDGKGFLGQRMLLVRLPRFPLGIARAGCRSAVPSQAEDDNGQNVLNVIGGGLDSEVEACLNLFQDFGKEVEVRTLRERPISALLQEIRGADLVHFTCHGHRDPLRLQIHKTKDPALNLLLHSVQGDDFCIKDRCLVYANACNSAVGELSFEEFVNFAWGFCEKGAAAFIGTLGAVPTRDALAFARRFYSRLASGDSGSIYSAYQATREEAFLAGPACLLFCIYGNHLKKPCFKIPLREGSGGGGGA